MDLPSLFAESPVVAAVKNSDGAARCIKSDVKIIFVLYGDILGVGKTVEALKTAGKTVFVHADLIGGLARDEFAVKFLKKNTRADGIISTKPALIRAAKQCGLVTIQRFFLIDSISFDNVIKQVETVPADCIEVLPGAMPKVISSLCRLTGKPVIAGGLITDKQDVMAALQAGASAVSTTREDVWFD